jgi:hypothetical protein
MVLGLDGDADDPEFMFCIPLSELKYSDVYPSILEKYERDPEKRFFWKNGILS